MKKWIVVASVMALSSCAYSPIYNGKEPYSGSQFMLMESPRHTMDFFVESLTEDLILSNTSVSARTPIAVTSFVDLQNMDSTNCLEIPCLKALFTNFSVVASKSWISKPRDQFK